MANQVRLLAAIGCALLCWVGARAAGARALEVKDQWPQTDSFMLVLPPEAAPILTAGYGELAADLTWTRMLVYYGSAKIGESDFRYLEQLIDNVIALDPYFLDVYIWASGAVTYRQARATQEEWQASARYLRLGIERFPNNYDLRHSLAMKLWWELGSTKEERYANRREAARVAELAMRLPSAPPKAATLIASMWTDVGEIEHARNTLKQMLLTTDSKEARAKMIARYKSLTDSPREIELLAAAKREFDKQHEENLPYAPSDLFVLLGPRPERKTIDELTRGTILGTFELLSEEVDIDDESPVSDGGQASDEANGDDATKTEPSP